MDREYQLKVKIQHKINKLNCVFSLFYANEIDSINIPFEVYQFKWNGIFFGWPNSMPKSFAMTTKKYNGPI